LGVSRRSFSISEAIYAATQSHIPEDINLLFTPANIPVLTYIKTTQQGQPESCNVTVLSESLHLFYCFRVDFLNVDGVRSTKLSEFLVHTFIFDLTGLAVVLNVTFPEINLDLDHYDLSAVALTIIPVDGNGTLQ
jgi:hypothetical protein